MKKRISIEGEGLAALKTIIGSASFSSRAEARKIHAAASWLNEPMKAYKAALALVQDTYGEEVADGEGAEQRKKMVVPDAKVPEYEAAIESARQTKYTVEFDRESFALCNALVDNLFAREEIKKQNGLAGIDQARNIDQISAAFESAIDL